MFPKIGHSFHEIAAKRTFHRTPSSSLMKISGFTLTSVNARPNKKFLNSDMLIQLFHQTTVLTEASCDSYH